MKLYALKEINTGLFYNAKMKDITELDLGVAIFKTPFEAFCYAQSPEIEYEYSYPVWFTTLSAIEKMYDKPIMEVDELTKEMIADTSSLFKFKVVPIILAEGNERG